MGKVFIGPSVDHLRMFGDKLSAKEAAQAADLPLLVGSSGAVGDADEAVAIATASGSCPTIIRLRSSHPGMS